MAAYIKIYTYFLHIETRSKFLLLVFSSLNWLTLNHQIKHDIIWSNSILFNNIAYLDYLDYHFKTRKIWTKKIDIVHFKSYFYGLPFLVCSQFLVPCWQKGMSVAYNWNPNKNGDQCFSVLNSSRGFLVFISGIE